MGLCHRIPIYTIHLIGNKYFHPGTTGDLHFDDPATIPASGMDIQGHISSGPYIIGPLIL